MQMRNSTRLHYIDVCKGILIIIVVLHHVFGLMRKYEYLPEQTDYIEKLYVPFFLVSFFVVTGFCSNYNKDFKSFLRQNIKTLLVPAVIFYLLIHSIDLMLTHQFTLLNSVKMLGRILIFGGVWFLTSLFFAKLIAYSLINNQKIKKIYHSDSWGGHVFVFLLFLMLLSSVLSTYKIIEPWCMYHSLGLVIFMVIGMYMKKLSIGLWTFISSLIVYAMYVCILVHYDMHLPRITSKLSLYPYEIPLFLIGAISGTLIVWYISKMIDRNDILEYLGRNSLEIYLTHWIIIKTLIVLWLVLFPNLEAVPSIMFVSLFVIALLICLGLVRVFQYRIFSWMIGRF